MSIYHWKLVYKFELANRVYTWIRGSCNMTYDHDVGTVLPTLDGRTEVKYKSQLTPHESQFIEGQCIIRTEIPLLSVGLERVFRNRSFGQDLLR